MAPLSTAAIEAIDRALQGWRQGDAILIRTSFLHLADQNAPLTRACSQSAEDAREGEQELEIVGVPSEVDGLVVVTQTCDIVRSCVDRPFVEVCPLVSVPESSMSEIKGMLRPAYGFVPATSSRFLVADLDRVMTIEKAVLVNWPQVQGCTTDQEVRNFAESLARKRSRPAFPNDFNVAIKKLAKRIREKHGKETKDKNGNATYEGKMLACLREIRVQAAPSWDEETVEAFFWFIREDDPEELRPLWAAQVNSWLDLVTQSRFNVAGVACLLSTMKASEYVESDRLDLDYLSTGS